MIPGVKIKLGEVEYEVPPLNIKLLRTFQADLDELTDPQKVAQMGLTNYALKAVPVVTAALQRNYPDLTTERVEEILPVGEVPAILKALFSVSGMEGKGNAVGAPGSPLEVPSAAPASV